jgi:CSLREA domain-containing protein
VLLAGGAAVCFGAAPAAHAATISPNTPFDNVAAADGACSLREAVIAANTNAASGVAAGECPAGTSGADTIILGGEEYDLRIAGAGEDAAAIGDLDVTETLSITGAGPADTGIDANDIDRAPWTRIPSSNSPTPR